MARELRGIEGHRGAREYDFVAPKTRLKDVAFCDAREPPQFSGQGHVSVALTAKS
jgi:hypothetical protein